MNGHKRSGTKQHFLSCGSAIQKFKMEAPRLKSRCWQGCVLPGDSREESFSLIISASRGHPQALANGQRASKSGWVSQSITLIAFSAPAHFHILRTLVITLDPAKSSRIIFLSEGQLYFLIPFATLTPLCHKM